MKISSLALGLTLGILWGAAMCVIGAIHAMFPAYGAEFFQLMASIYPGITGTGALSDIVVATLYGLLDGFFFGFLMAWLYNLVLTKVIQR